MPDTDDTDRNGTVVTPQAVLNPEILRIILSFANHSTLHSCIQVNSTFYEVAGPLLYREVRINGNGLSSFTRATVVPAPIADDGNISHYVRTSQLELLKHIEVVEIASHTSCCESSSPHCHAVFDALARAKVVRLLYSHGHHSRRHKFCAAINLVDTYEGYLSYSSGKETCHLLETLKPSALVIYSARNAGDCLWTMPEAYPIFAPLFEHLKSVVILYPLIPALDNELLLGDLLPPRWSGPTDVIFTDVCWTISKRAGAPDRTKTDRECYTLGELSKAIHVCVDAFPHMVNIFYLSDKALKPRKKDYHVRIITGAQVKSYVKRTAQSSLLAPAGIPRLGFVKLKAEYVASGRKHEIPEEVMIEWAEHEGSKKSRKLLRETSIGKEALNARTELPKGQTATAEADLGDSRVEMGWTRSGRAKRLKI